MISIIVPIYNSEKFLNQCIESILEQTYTYFEVLLINDGSTDNSEKICNDFAIQDQRVKIFHKENGGVSSARNLGLEHAKGEWICFVDSDDYLDKSYLQTLLNALNNDVEFVIQSLSKFTQDNRQKSSYKITNQYIKTSDFLSQFNVTEFGYAAGKIYKNEIIQINKLRFNEKIVFGEDCVFLMIYLQCINSLYLSSTNKYYYRETIDGLSTKTGGVLEEEYLFTTILDRLKYLHKKNNVEFVEKNMIGYNVRFLRAIYVHNNINTSQRILLLKKYKKEFIVCFDKRNKSAFLLATLLKLNLFSVFDFFYQQVTFKNG